MPVWRAALASPTRASLCLASMGLVACASTLSVPDYGAPRGEPIVVPFAPPPARVDVIADPPPELSRPVWVDGQWLWRGGRWVWEPGEWVELDPETVYARPRVVRRSDGQLVWFEGAFVTRSEQR